MHTLSEFGKVRTHAAHSGMRRRAAGSLMRGADKAPERYQKSGPKARESTRKSGPEARESTQKGVRKLCYCNLKGIGSKSETRALRWALQFH
jgi:hypothetical protein